MVHFVKTRLKFCYCAADGWWKLKRDWKWTHLWILDPFWISSVSMEMCFILYRNDDALWIHCRSDSCIFSDLFSMAMAAKGIVVLSLFQVFIQRLRNVWCRWKGRLVGRFQTAPGWCCSLAVLFQTRVLSLLWILRVTSPQVRAHQLVLPPCDVVIKAVADYVRDIPDIADLEAIAKDIFKHSQVWEAEQRRRVHLLLRTGHSLLL